MPAADATSSSAWWRDRSLIACLKPYAGLGNRIRVMLSAAALARAEQRAFVYSWPTGRHFGARLDDLWQVSGPTLPPAVTRALSLVFPYRDEKVDWRENARDARIWQIRTSQPVQSIDGSTRWWSALRDLVPERELASRIHAFHDRHLSGTPYVGVMIRAHENSHAQSRQQSPIEWFEQRMTQIRQAHPDVGFFVSCDVERVQQMVLDRFPHTYALTDKGAYNSREAIRAAVVYLYLLAGAAHVIGPHYSSFPEMAVHLAGGRIALETSATAAADLPDLGTVLTSAAAEVSDPLRPAGP